MKIYHHRVEIYKKPVKWRWHKDLFEIKEKEILAENDRYIVLNDSNFTKLEKKGDGAVYCTLNKENISINIDDRVWEDSVYYTLYSTSKRRPKTIRKHIEDKIKKKYGWLLSEIDLSIIK